MSDSLRTPRLQHARLLSPLLFPSLLRFMSLSRWCMPSSHLILCHSLLLLPSVFPQHQGLSQGLDSLHQVARVLEFQLQHQSFQWIFRTDFFLYDGLVGSPCCPRDSQESSPTPQIKSISSLALSFPYSPTLISIKDYRENHSFD